MWCITGFTRDNGPLRIIPGSHRSARYPVDDMEFQGMGPHSGRGEADRARGIACLVQQRQPVALRDAELQPGLRLAVTRYLSVPAKASSA